MIKKLKECRAVTETTVLFIAKVGKKYIAEKNGELCRSTVQGEAFCFKTIEEGMNFLQNAGVDDRNNRVIGSRCYLIDVTIQPKPTSKTLA